MYKFKSKLFFKKLKFSPKNKFESLAKAFLKNFDCLINLFGNSQNIRINNFY